MRIAIVGLGAIGTTFAAALEREGHQDEFFAAYGIARDEERIRYYRQLWNLES